MTQKNQIYKCNICGNIIEVLHKGADALVCCNQPMILQEENTVDAAQEKHVPVIETQENKTKIKVGEIPHPMEPEHYIEWIEIITDNKSPKKFLKPGEEPEAEFCIQSENITARAYCNLHGLWKNK